MDTNTWKAVQSSQVIVDGPLVCLQFVPATSRVLVGSLCGYVMLLDNDTGSPRIVAAELQGHEEDVEDSVLAVHGWDNWVAIGTQAGVLLLYCSSSNNNNEQCSALSSSYVKAGEWHLPYSVHEICHHGNSLLVTTRKSLHLFTLHERPKLDAQLAKDRIQRLLKLAPPVRNLSTVPSVEKVDSTEGSVEVQLILDSN